MKIDLIEDRIERISDRNYLAIIELIVEAVRSFPMYNLNDTEVYFDEVKKIIRSEKINLIILKNYIKENENTKNDNDIWIMDSLYSLLEAFELMNLYSITLDQVKEKIISLNG